MPFWINMIVATIAFGITASSGLVLIPYLKKLKFGQTILDIGPKWHKNKQGTPTMGGFMFALGTILATLLGLSLYNLFTEKTLNNLDNKNLDLFLGLGMAVLYMLVGFLDDYIKVVKKQNLGLNAKQKLIMQIAIAGGYLYALKVLGATTSVLLPFFGMLNLGVFYYPIMAIFIIFIVNSVNLTDGIDGLCTSVTLIYGLCAALIFILLNQWSFTILSMALAGSCLGFLVWNLHPAKVFMGDTGSMFLGGIVVAIGFSTGLHLLIIVMGIIYVIESLSVILQVISFKTTGKRIFKMSPIHHHFEMNKWSEYKIVIVFSIITLIAGITSIGITAKWIENTINL